MLTLRLSDPEVRFIYQSMTDLPLLDPTKTTFVNTTADEWRRAVIENRMKNMGGDAAIIEWRRQNAHRFAPVEQPVQSFDDKLSSLSVF
jgi:hypothetical protein